MKCLKIQGTREMQVKNKQFKYKNPISENPKAIRNLKGGHDNEDEAVNIGAETKKVGGSKDGLSRGNSFCN